jgi:hypothetical protein
LRDFYYKPALTAAFLLDPVNFSVSREGKFELPFSQLSDSEEREATEEIERPAGQDSERAIDELADLCLNGLSGLSNLELRLVKQCLIVNQELDDDGAAPQTSAAPVHKRRQLRESVLGKLKPVLAKVAGQLLSMHSTSCASERNLSVFGRLHDKLRGSLHLDRGQKLVYLAVNDRMTRGKLDISEEDLPFADCAFDDVEELEVQENTIIAVDA